MKYIENKLMGKNLTLSEVIDIVLKEINNNLIGIDSTKGGNGSLAVVRKQEIMSAYNRYRKLKIKRTEYENSVFFIYKVL